MKKIIFLFAILFTFSFAGKAQSKTYSIDSIFDITWKVHSFNVDGNIMKHTEAQKKDNWMIFYKDGKHKVSTQGQISNASWEYDKKTNMFSFKDNGDVMKQKIIKLTSTEFILEGSFSGSKLIIHLVK